MEVMLSNNMAHIKINMFLVVICRKKSIGILDCSNTDNRNINAIICHKKMKDAFDQVRLRFPQDHKRPKGQLTLGGNFG